MTTNSFKAKISWFTDLISTATVLILCSSWIHSIQSPKTALLSPSFLENGFCLSPLFENTHLSCSKFDALCGIVCVMGMIFTRRSSWAGAAAYFFSHAYGHYDAGISLVKAGALKQERVEMKDMIVLAAILSIGPLSSASELIGAGKVGRRVGNVCAFLGLGGGVAVYAGFIRRPCYALLYINVFVILARSLPRVVLMGYTSPQDMSIRAARFSYTNVISQLVMVAVIFCEPFYCDSFVRFIGGHALFDVVLAVDILVNVLSDGGSKTHLTLKKVH